jgi:hypothetical protein
VGFGRGEHKEDGSMSQVSTPKRRAGIRSFLLGYDHAATGVRLSMLLSVLAGIGIWLFFIRMHGWKPPTGQEVDYSTYVHWLLLAFLAIQLTTLVFANWNSAGSEVWLDTFTSMIPMILGLWVLVLHWTKYATLPLEQLRYAKSVAAVMAIDFIVDFAVAVRSRKTPERKSTTAQVTLQSE